MTVPRYKRILLKLSGEAFSGNADFGIDMTTVARVAKQIKKLARSGVEVGIVVGGGNILRGHLAEKEGMDRATADYAGMLVAEPYIRRRAIRHLEKGRVVIFAAGTGNPYMSTDTAAALRSIEIGAEILLMAKNKVDGIYTADPHKNLKAKKFDKLTYLQALNMRLEIMDSTALSLCLENKLPIIVFDLQSKNSLERAVSGESIGTLVTSEV
jgi:uridylate kinase